MDTIGVADRTKERLVNELVSKLAGRMVSVGAKKGFDAGDLSESHRFKSDILRLGVPEGDAREMVSRKILLMAGIDIIF